MSKERLFYQLLVHLTEHLRDKGKVYLTGTYIDATFVEAKQGVFVSEKLKAARGARSWQSRTVSLYLSPHILRVLHHMRVSLLKNDLGTTLFTTYLCELWVTKLTIQMNSILRLNETMESNSLLPISAIESRKQLKMVDLFEDTEKDGEWNDSSPGFNSIEGLRLDTSINLKISLEWYS